MSTNLVNTSFKNIQTAPVLKQKTGLVVVPTVSGTNNIAQTIIPGSYSQGDTITDVNLVNLVCLSGTSTTLSVLAVGLTGPAPGTPYPIGTVKRWQIANNTVTPQFELNSTAVPPGIAGIPLPKDCWLGLYASITGSNSSFSYSTNFQAIVSYTNLL
jgi:hypothetical protein